LIKAHLIAGFGALLAGVSCTALAQSNPNNSAQNPYVGSVQVVAPTPTVLPLSLDDALRLGIEDNLALILARENQKLAHAEKLQIINYLTPNLTLHGETGIRQYNLAAEGFHPADVAAFAGQLPGVSASATPLFTQADVTNGQLNLNQELFSWAGWDAWRAAKANVQASDAGTASSRGLVVLNVGNLYLEALAARTQVDLAKALLASDQRALYDAHQQHLAGTAANLDELRARVQAQAQQQVVLQAEDDFEKSKIALNRAIGLAPEQKIQLTEAAPYANLVAMSIDDARQQAYANRQDFQTLKAQIRAAEFERRATVHERFPSLSFSGSYGITGVSSGFYHDTFGAVGNLSIPIFQEAKFRSDRDVAEAQLDELRTQLEDLKQKIDQQLRDSLLDLQTADQLVRVSRSNLDLANTALEQTDERAQAGIDTNLPVVEAQATVAQAQTQYVQSVLQLNEAKLGLARNLGLIDAQYKAYRTGNPPPLHSNKAAGH
jgi:outer membrane protein TolC